jgi:hypothetical protein
MKIEQYCQQATQQELIDLFADLSKALLKQRSKVLKSSQCELTTKVGSKKQMDTLYANSFNDIRVYNTLLADLKILVKYMI